MAGASEGIPVSRARVPVTPYLDKADASKMKTQTVQAVANTAEEAGQAFDRSFVPRVTAALQAMASESDKAGKRSEAALKAAATRAAQAQARALDWVVQKEGESAAIAVRLAFNAADEKHKALLGLSARHKRVLSTMGLEEENAVKAMVRASELGEARKQALFKETALQYKAVLREKQAALVASLREGLRDYKAAKTEEIAAERQVTLDYKAELADRLTTLRSELAAATAAQEAASVRQAGLLAAAGARWRRGSQAIEHMGVQSAEMAALLNRNVVAPLALAGGAAVTFGVKATDSFDKAANSLGGLGVSVAATAKLLNNLQNFAINSSFSLEDMNEFAPQYVRIMTSHGTKPDKAAAQSEALIKAIANNAAKGGITDPEKLARAMQQVAYIMDTDKLTLRNLKPFENATNMSMEQVAKMLGYEDKDGVSKVYSKKQHWTQKTKKGKPEWVKDDSGRYVQSGFENGKPKFVVDEGKPGKKQSASAQLMADMTASSAPSGHEFVEKLIKSGDEVTQAAKRAQNATVSGRLQAMKETFQRDLMGLFAKRDEDGNFKVRRDADTGMLTHVPTDLYKSVLKVLDGLDDLWQTTFPGLKVAAKAFVDGLNRVISIATGTADFIADHPALQSFLKTLISFSVKALPLLIAFGVAAKLLGKTGKLLGGFGSTIKGAGKLLAGGARLATRGIRGAKHLGSGMASRRGGDGFLSGYRGSRERSRQARESGWGWTNRLREERGQARARWGASRLETVRGYARATTQYASGGLIDWDDRDRRRNARQRYRRERRNLRDLDRLQPQTAENASGLLQLERDRRANRERWQDERRSGRRRDRDEYEARRTARPYVLDRRDEEAYAQRRQDRRAASRASARDHLPAVPQSNRQRLTIQVGETERAIQAVEEKLKALGQEVQRINLVRLEHVRGEFDGSTASISRSAINAREAIEHIRSIGITTLNAADLTPIQGKLYGLEGASLSASAVKAESAVKDIKTQALEPLNGVSLAQARNELDGEVSSLRSAAAGAGSKVRDVRSDVTYLNETASTGLVRDQFDGVKGSLKLSVQEAKGAVTRLDSAIDKLNSARLEGIIAKFTGPEGIKSAVNETKDTVGLPSGRSGLHYALSKINSVTFSGKDGLEKKLKSVREIVDSVTKAVGELKLSLMSVNDVTGGGHDGNGGGNGKKGGGTKPRGRSSIAAPQTRGFVDHGIHASFGGGAIGPAAGAGGAPGGGARSMAAPSMSFMAAPRISAMSASSGGTRTGGSGRGGGLSRLFGGLEELQDILNLAPLARTATAAVGVDAASSRLGGVGQGIRGWVGDKVTWAGSRFRGLPDKLSSWFTTKLPPFLVRQPEGAPWTQLAGLAMGIAGPVASQAFMDDFYHGHGNAIGRGKRMAGDIFSLDTLKELFSSLTELIKSVAVGVEELLKLAGRFVTNPGSVLGDLKDYGTDLFSGFVDSFTESFNELTRFLDNPSEYTQEVWADLLAGLKEALPNLDGLFDFSKGYSKGGVVSGYSPGRDSVVSLLSPGESVLRPELTKLLGTDQIDGMNAAARAGNWKSLAELIDEMWRTLIQPAFVNMSQEVRTDLVPTTTAFKSQSEDTWRSVGRAVQSAWSADVQPSLTLWVNRLRGDMTTSEADFLDSHRVVWAQAAQHVDRSKQSSLASFSALGGGLDTLEGQFRSSASSIQSTWQSAMSYVDSSTRSTVDGPYNRGAVGMTGAMAELAGASSPLTPLHFAHGGVVEGYAPGRDIVPAVLSPGEGVLRPEVVRALGPATIHAWNRAARLGGNMFANGGIVQPISSWGQSGGDWVSAHKNDPYQGYADAIEHGWSDNINGMTSTLRDAFGTMGRLTGGAFDSFKGSVIAWGRYLDDHVGGASAAVKVAQQELGYTETGPNMVKYNEFNGEEWCADFISWVVDHAGANSSYWGSPRGTPENRWPSVSTWNDVASGSLIGAAEARAGDIVTFRNGGHIGLVESVSDGVLHTIEGNVGPTVMRLTRQFGDPDHVFRARGGVSEGPSFSGWPGAYARGVEIPTAGGVDGGTPSQNKNAARQMLAAMGWSSQFGALDNIWTNESNWDQFARNPTSGAYGIPQSLPAEKMAAAGDDWLTNPVTQMRWGLGYIRDAYGDPERAWEFWQRNHWYAKGTRNASPGLALVGEEGPELVVMNGGERVHTARETADLLGGRSITVHVHAAPDVPTEDTIMRALERAHIMHGL